MGDNTRAAVISRGLAELTRLGVAMGAEPATMAGLAGMGDLIATCVSPLSRNRQVGERLGKGESIDEILGSMNMVAEGVKTAHVVMELAARYGVDLPICAEIRRVVSGEISAVEAYRGLMARAPAGHEAGPGDRAPRLSRASPHAAPGSAGVGFGALREAVDVGDGLGSDGGDPDAT